MGCIFGLVATLGLAAGRANVEPAGPVASSLLSSGAVRQPRTCLAASVRTQHPANACLPQLDLIRYNTWNVVVPEGTFLTRVRGRPKAGLG